MSTPRTVSFHTLGCKLNFSESSALAKQFENNGFQVQKWELGSDIFVLNTCSVTDFADRKCRKAVRDVLAVNPDTKVVVVGCYAQLKPKEIAEIEGVDLVLGAKEKFNLIHYVEQLGQTHERGWVQASEIQEVNEFVQAFSHEDRTRAFLKVQDGCDYKCSFCTIPLARGKSRSDTIQNVLKNVETIAASGKKEIVLTGVNLGDFGNGTAVIEGVRTKKEALFIDLIQALENTSIDRYRISSIEPNLLTDEIIDFVSQSKKFVPHFHIPLQSGSPEILKLMQRRYKREVFTSRVERIKQTMPHACIGVDVIVGFPMESESHFKETMNYLHDLDISYLHVFTYSERPNTKAIDLPEIVPVGERRNRNRILRNISSKKKRAFYEQFIGTKREALIEQSKEDGRMSGYTDNYIRLDLPFQEDVLNTLQTVELTQVLPNGLMLAKIL